MDNSFKQAFTLSDGTEVQVQISSENCYDFMLLSPDGKEDTFTWDADEARDMISDEELSEDDRRRNAALQALWDRM